MHGRSMELDPGYMPILDPEFMPIRGRSSSVEYRGSQVPVQGRSSQSYVPKGARGRSSSATHNTPSPSSATRLTRDDLSHTSAPTFVSKRKASADTLGSEHLSSTPVQLPRERSSEEQGFQRSHSPSILEYFARSAVGSSVASLGRPGYKVERSTGKRKQSETQTPGNVGSSVASLGFPPGYKSERPSSSQERSTSADARLMSSLSPVVARYSQHSSQSLANQSAMMSVAQDSSPFSRNSKGTRNSLESQSPFGSVAIPQEHQSLHFHSKGRTRSPSAEAAVAPVYHSTEMQFFQPKTFDAVSSLPATELHEDTPLAATISAASLGRDISLMRLVILLVGWVLCAVTWAIGVCFPSLQLDVLVGTPMHYSITKSLQQSLETLFHQKMFVAFGLLAFFSVVVPLIKMSCTLWILYSLSKTKRKDVYIAHKRLLWLLSSLASYQFVDLYVGVLFVAYFNSDSSDSHTCVGFNVFFVYCVISCTLSEILEGSFASVMSLHSPRKNLEDEHATIMDTEGQTLQRLTAAMAETVKYVEYADPIQVVGSPRDLVSGCDLSKQNEGLQHSQGGSFNMRAVVAAVSSPLGAKQNVNTKCVWFFSACYIILLIPCMLETLLELRLLLEGVTIDRNALSPKDIMVDMLPRIAHPIVVCSLWFFIIVAPLLYISTLVIRASWLGAPRDILSMLRAASELLRQWAMMDVFAIATLIFLCMLQDTHTSMMPSDGSCAYYAYLGAACALFFLRWFAEKAADFNYKSWVLIAVWMVICAIILHGVPGAVRHYRFHDLSAVCQHGREVMNTVIGSMPRSFGDCDDHAAHPPLPCSGNAPVYQDGSEKSGIFTKAIWLGGLNTMQIDFCSLTRESLEVVAGASQFHLTVAGKFEKIQLYIRANSGPVRMDSADHCCGKNISFKLKFAVDCFPGFARRDGINNIRMERCDLDPMYVEEKTLGGILKINAMVDLSGLVEKLVKDHIHSFVSKVHIQWGGLPMSVSQMLNKLVMYNAPRKVGQC